MGIDFIRKAAPSFRKGLDRRRIELATPTLFTQEPASVPRAYAARLRGDKSQAIDEKTRRETGWPKCFGHARSGPRRSLQESDRRVEISSSNVAGNSVPCVRSSP